MIKYFVAKILLFDEEEFHTEESLPRILAELLDRHTKEGFSVLWEKVKVKEVQLSEYEKEN